MPLGRLFQKIKLFQIGTLCATVDPFDDFVGRATTTGAVDWALRFRINNDVERQRSSVLCAFH